MKGILKSKLFGLIFALTMLLCSVFGIVAVQNGKAKADVKTPVVSIEANNVSYSDSVYILYAVSNENFNVQKNSVKMLFWEEVQQEYILGTELYSATTTGTATVKGKKCQIFYSNGLSAKKMTDDVFARACVEIDGEVYYSDVVKFSVLEYVYRMRENGGLTNEQQNLFDSMLDYGAAAQHNFDYNVDRIANGEYYSITIINGKLPDGFAHGRYKNKDQIKVKADKAPQGMKFSHWEDETGIIISYEEQVTIELKGNKTYKAVYKDISNVSNQLVLTAEIPFDGTIDSVELPTAVSFEYNGEQITLDVVWNTSDFVMNKIGTQTIYASLVDGTAYNKYDIAEDGILMQITTLPYTYSLDQATGNYVLTGYFGSDSQITLPSTYKNTLITTIASNAFNGVLSLTNVVIPNTITKIEQGAFNLCDNIESITIPFVGESATSNNGWFGYIFGASGYLDNEYHVPSSLKTVVITGGTSIGRAAFYFCTLLTSIVIPNSVTSIGNSAFDGCYSLTSIEIPNSVASIGDSAFSNCYSLTSIELPNGVTSIGDYAFYYCYSLTSIEIPDSVTSIGDYAFCNCYSLTSVVIPNSVTSIGYSAFSGCESLTSVTIGNSVTSIGEYAFEYCTSLTSIEIPNSVTSIGNYAFAWCTSLKSVVIPDSVTSIGGWAFYECTSLTSIEIPNSVTSIGSYAFYRCSSLTIYCEAESKPSSWSSDWNISNRPVVWGYCAYTQDLEFTLINNDTEYEVSNYNGADTNVIIPKTYNGKPVTSIGSGAFSYCDSLTSIEIPDSVTSIGDFAFSWCDSLTSAVIGDSVTSIGDCAFRECISLTSIEIPNSVTSIGDGAFYNCSSLTKVNYTGTIDSWAQIEFDNYSSNPLYYAEKLYINNELVTEVILTTATKINAYAFYNCSSLTNVEIPDSVTSIGSYAFRDCTSLTSAVIGDSVTSIGDGAFDNCTSLTSVVIGDNVTSIGNGAFYGCSSLTSAVIGDSVTSIGYSAFESCSSLTSILIPDSVTSIGNNAFSGCESLTCIVIPDSVTSIGDYAFQYCSSLTIYCEAETEPSSWSSDWNKSKCPVVWGYVQDKIEMDVTYNFDRITILNEQNLTDKEILGKFSINQVGSCATIEELEQKINESPETFRFYIYLESGEQVVQYLDAYLDNVTFIKDGDNVMAYTIYEGQTISIDATLNSDGSVIIAELNQNFYAKDGEVCFNFSPIEGLTFVYHYSK